MARKAIKLALAGMVTVATLGVTGSPAAAADYRDYNLGISHDMDAIVNFCLRAETYDKAKRDRRESCSGTYSTRSTAGQ